jgi:hypothetical protein
VKKYFRIGSSSDRNGTFFQLSSKLQIIIDLAVKNYFTMLKLKWLIRVRLKINDAQTTVEQIDILVSKLVLGEILEIRPSV